QPTTSSMRFCRVSVRFAKIIQCNIIFFSVLLNPKKKSLDPLCFLNDFSRSLGIINSSILSKIFQDPFCLATSMISNPACVIKPLSISFFTFSLLIFDHVLLAFLLLKNCFDDSESILIFLLSNHPRQSATSTASLHVTDG